MHVYIYTSVLHPGLRLEYFQDVSIWGDLMEKGRNLLEYLFETYKLEADGAIDENPSLNSGPISSEADTSNLSWSDQLVLDFSRCKLTSALEDELSRYFNNIYKFRPGTNVLDWWKVWLTRIYIILHVLT